MKSFLFKISSGLDPEYKADLVDSLYIVTISVLNKLQCTDEAIDTSRNSLEFVVVCLSFDNRVFTSGCERTFNLPGIVSGCR
jgi:hypothetical protein